MPEISNVKERRQAPLLALGWCGLKRKRIKQTVYV